jgi:integrase
MPRKAKELSSLEVRRLTRPGRWSVGGVDGLGLQVTQSGAQSWVLRFRIAARQREMGLGSFPTVSLAAAREKARQLRSIISDGGDPIAMMQAKESSALADRQAQKTFSEVAAQYIAHHEKSWKSAKHQAQWASTLRAYAEPSIGKLLLRDIKPTHVISILEPLWSTKTETATRVRSRIELVLDYAAARGFREGLNPARWKGNLDAALPEASKVAPVRHHVAVEVKDGPSFMKRLKAQPGMGARALEFAVLTAARSGEVRGATWSEIDLTAMLWIVPASRMKARREHRVPLSKEAAALLAALPGDHLPHDHLFRGMRGPLSDMSLTAVLRRMNVAATAHGFRSTFRDWVSEHTEYSGEVAEMALSHAIGDKVEAAYRRGDLLAKRAALMADWASFLGASPQAVRGGA